MTLNPPLQSITISFILCCFCRITNLSCVADHDLPKSRHSATARADPAKWPSLAAIGAPAATYPAVAATGIYPRPDGLKLADSPELAVPNGSAEPDGVLDHSAATAAGTAIADYDAGPNPAAGPIILVPATAAAFAAAAATALAAAAAASRSQ